MIVNLPKPISTNSLFQNKRRGRVKTERYNTWCHHARAMILDQRPPRMTQPVRITFAVGTKGLRGDMDGDNCLKCLLDALVSNGVIEDDNRQFVRGVGMEWVEGKEGTTAYIEPATDPIEFARSTSMTIPFKGVVE